MSSLALAFSILAKDKASPAFNSAGKSADRLHAKTKLMAAGAAAAIGSFAKHSVDKFTEVGKETIKLQRYIGGTIEDASRLRFAAEESGVGMDDLSRGLGKLAKFTVGAGDQFTAYEDALKKASAAHKPFKGHLGTAATAFAKMGIAVKDAKGNLLPMSQLLPQVAEQFKSMPNGTQKTALALQLFGKGGMTLLPFLNKGADGIKELSKESDKFGNTLTSKDTKAVMANIIAKRQWHATITGVQIQLSRALLPALTAITGGLQRMTQFVQNNSAVIKPLAVILGTVGVTLWTLVKVTRAYTAVQAALNVVMAMNPIGLVVVAVAALVAGFIIAYKKSDTFRKVVHAAMHGVAAAFDFVKDHWRLFATAFAILLGPFVGGIVLLVAHFQTFKRVALAVFGAVGGALSAVWNSVIRPVLHLIVGAWLGVVGALVNGAAKAFGWVPGLGGKLKSAAKAFSKFADEVNASLDGIHKSVTVRVKATFAGYGTPSPSHENGFASGTRSAPRGWAWTGEKGPELIKFRGGERVFDARTSASMASSGSGGRGDVHLHGDIIVPDIRTALSVPEQIRDAVWRKAFA